MSQQHGAVSPKSIGSSNSQLPATGSLQQTTAPPQSKAATAAQSIASAAGTNPNAVPFMPAVEPSSGLDVFGMLKREQWQALNALPVCAGYENLALRQDKQPKISNQQSDTDTYKEKIPHRGDFLHPRLTDNKAEWKRALTQRDQQSSFLKRQVHRNLNGSSVHCIPLPPLVCALLLTREPAPPTGLTQNEKLQLLRTFCLEKERPVVFLGGLPFLVTKHQVWFMLKVLCDINVARGDIHLHEQSHRTDARSAWVVFRDPADAQRVVGNIDNSVLFDEHCWWWARTHGARCEMRRYCVLLKEDSDFRLQQRPHLWVTASIVNLDLDLAPVEGPLLPVRGDAVVAPWLPEYGPACFACYDAELRASSIVSVIPSHSSHPALALPAKHVLENPELMLFCAVPSAKKPERQVRGVCKPLNDEARNKVSDRVAAKLLAELPDKPMELRKYTHNPYPKQLKTKTTTTK